MKKNKKYSIGDKVKINCVLFPEYNKDYIWVVSRVLDDDNYILSSTDNVVNTGIINSFDLIDV